MYGVTNLPNSMIKEQGGKVLTDLGLGSSFAYRVHGPSQWVHGLEMLVWSFGATEIISTLESYLPLLWSHTGPRCETGSPVRRCQGHTHLPTKGRS